MSDSEPWYETVVTPWMLDAARRGYGKAMRESLSSAGFDDVPPFGIRLLGGIRRNGPLGPDVARQLGIGEARATRLVADLTGRGYIEPEGDRLVLTDRGKDAAAASAAGLADFERLVEERVGSDDLALLRTVLASIIEMSDPHFER